MEVKIEKCLNGYLLALEDEKIILSEDDFQDLKEAVSDYGEDAGEEKPKRKTRKKAIKKRKYTRRKKVGTKEKDTWRRKTGHQPEGTMRKYKCEKCDEKFKSDSHYLDVKCPECKSRKCMKLPD